MGRWYTSCCSRSNLPVLAGIDRRSLSAGAVVSLALLAAGQALVAQENPAAVNALWVAESSGVIKVATADGSLALEIPGLAPVRAVAVDHHRPTVWLYAGQNLYAYGYDGTRQLAVALALPNPANAALAVDEHDGSIWLGADQNLVSVAASGQVLQSLRLADNVKSLAVDAADALVWVGTASSAAAYDAVAGTAVVSLDLGASPDLRDLDLDPAGKVWVALGGAVRRYAADGTLLLAVPMSSPLHVAGDGHGGAWVTTSKNLLAVNPAGQVSASLSPFGGQGTIVEVVLDPSNGDAWLANDRAVAQVNAGGQLVRAFQFQPPVHIRDLALYADVIPPQLAITAPADGSFLDRRTPTITVTYSDVGSGVNAATLAFTANGSPLQVSCSTTAAGTSCVVANPFPDGPEAVTATVKDYAGNASQAATVTFTIDTTPPAPVTPRAVTVTAPAGGSSTVSAGAGSAEPAAAVLLTDVKTGATATTTVAADGSFLATIACQAGDAIQIVLRDAAGNSSAPATVTVPGAAGNGLPPDPSTVATPVDRTVATDIAAATAFLYTGPNPIQRGVQTGAVDPFLVAVLRGSVHDRSGQPIPGVSVTVLGHPELGSTLTRTDGVFDMAANGGGLVTVQFDKSGYLTARRQVNAPWRDYAWLDDVVLVQTDAAATFVDTSLAALQVIRGTAVQDQDGSRQATLLFPAGTSARLVLPGGQTQLLPTLTVRATEYTVGATGPKAMPAPLPPTSAYTYAVELSADEAAASGGTVQFSQPLPFYLENFLDFPVGGIVPAGYYDRAKAAWIASDNGLVVKILSVTAGLADLDVAGAGSPASPAALAALGITSDERQSLATLYPVGQSLWRVPVRHFSPWDFNWPGEWPPEILAPSNPDLEPPPDLADPCDQPGASSIGCENQTLGEDVPIAGTPFTLHYQGDRVPGRLDPRSVQITLSGPNLPPNLVGIDLEVTIAGRRFQQSFAPGANLSTTFTWDGVDAYGRLLQGEFPVTVTVTNLISGAYALPPATLPKAFAEPPFYVIVSADARYVFSFSRSYTKSIGFVDAAAEKLGGWTLNVHHDYDPTTRTVWRGDGARENADPIATSAMSPLACTSTEASRLRLSGDGSLDLVSGGIEIYRVDRGGDLQPQYVNFDENVPEVAVTVRDQANRLFFASCSGSFGSNQTEIRRVLDLFDSQLVFSLSQVPCGTLHDLVPDGAGGFYLAAESLLHVREDGSVATLIDASAVSRFAAWSVVVAPDGSFLVGDWTGGRIFRLDPAAHLTVVAGTGTPGFSGDGGPAVDAQLNGVLGVTVASDGSLWLTEWGRVRHIDASGIIRTIAGGGFGTPDAGVSPYAVSFFSPVGIDPNGALYFVDPFAGFPQGFCAWRVGDPFPGFSTNGFVVASQDGGEAYEFSAAGRHLRTLDPVTGAVLYSFSYDGANLLSGIQDRDGRLTRIQRDPLGNAAVIVSPDGQATTLATGPDGYLQTVTDPAAEAVSFTYATGGLMATQTDPRGFRSTYQYSGNGRLVLDTDAAGGFKSFQRTAGQGFESVTMTTGAGDTSQFAVQYPAAGGRLRLFTGPDGSTVRSAMAPNGQQTETRPDGSVVTTTLGPDPRFGLQSPIVTGEQTRMPSGLTMSTSSSRSAVLSVAGDPLSLSTLTESWTVNGNTFTRLFDRSQMTWTFQTPTGRQFIETVDSAGRPTSFAVGNLAATQLAYDSAGRVTSLTQGSGTTQRTVGLAYGTDGRLRSLTDPLQRTFTFAWDAAGRLTSQTFADGRMVGYTYDAAGNLTALTPPGRPSHGFTFTPVDLQQSYVPPDLGTGPAATISAYDPDRRLTTISRPDGRIVHFNYQLGRLSSVNYDRGTISFTYDPTTSLLQTVSAPGGETLAYTSDGPLPTRTTWSGPIAGSVERSFGPDFKMSAVTVNGQLTARYQYDNDGLLIQAGNMNISRDPSTGLMVGTTLGSLTTLERRNGFGELSSSSAAYAGNDFFRAAFTRDAGGRIARRVETISGATSTYDYLYDAAGRLTDVSLNAAPLSHYSYDANSNRTLALEGSTTTMAVYDAQDRLLTAGNMSYSYNANGDLIGKEQNGSTITYAYDALGDLTTVIDANGIETDYILDGQRLRVGKMVAGVPVQGFVWLDRSKIAAESDGAGNIISRFIYARGDNAPDLILKDGLTYLVIKDQLGGPRLLVDAASGQVAQRMDYDAWGRVILDTNPGFQPFGFAGGLYDARTGLVRFGARDYDPAAGRWTTRDPILFRGGDTNLYGYVVSDPINFSDREGLETFDCKVFIATNGRNPSRDPDGGIGFLYHEYLCVIDDNFNVTCGGQGNTGSDWTWDKWFHTVPGTNDSRAFSRKGCTPVDKRKCVDDCVKQFLDAPRPPFSATNADGGLNCQAWALGVVDLCKKGCPSK